MTGRLMLVGLAMLALMMVGCGMSAEEEAAKPEKAANTPVATSTLPPPPPEPTSVEVTMKPEDSRCLPAPQAVVQKLSWGLTAEGFNTHVEGVQMVENNDDRPWIFIGAEIVAPGMEGERPVWATAYIDADGNADFLAANTMAEEFSVWDKSGAGGFAPKFDDEIKAVKKCVDEALGTN